MTDEKNIDHTAQKKPRNWARIGLSIIMFAFAISLLAFTLGYFSLMYNQISLQRTVESIQSKLSNDGDKISNLEQGMEKNNEILQKSLALTNKQETLLNEWRDAQKGDLHRWQIAEASYLVRLANEQLQFNHNLPVAIELLQQAQQTLASLEDPNLVSIKKALADDIAALQALPRIDVTNTYVRLAALDEHIDELPLKSVANQMQVKQSNTAPPIDEVWWETGLRKTWEGLKQIVIVRRTDGASLPLTMPDEKMFLYQNLHSQMAAVMWSLLHRDETIYQVSLARMLGWVQTYFVLDDSAVQSFMQNLNELRKIELKQTNVNLANTLQLFEQYSKAQSSQATQ